MVGYAQKKKAPESSVPAKTAARKTVFHYNTQKPRPSGGAEPCQRVKLPIEAMSDVDFLEASINGVLGIPAERPIDMEYLEKSAIAEALVPTADQLNAAFSDSIKTANASGTRAEAELAKNTVTGAESIDKDKKILAHAGKQHDEEILSEDNFETVKANEKERLNVVNYIKDDYELHTDFASKLRNIRQKKRIAEKTAERARLQTLILANDASIIANKESITRNEERLNTWTNPDDLKRVRDRLDYLRVQETKLAGIKTSLTEAVADLDDKIKNGEPPTPAFITQATRRFTKGTKKMRISYNDALVSGQADIAKNTFDIEEITDDRAYYEHGTKRIYMDLERDTKGGPKESEMVKRHEGAPTTFHEMGHYIDFHLGRIGDDWYDKAELDKKLRADFAAYEAKRAAGGNPLPKTGTEAYVVDATLREKEMDDVSDIVHGVTSTDTPAAPAAPPVMGPKPLPVVGEFGHFGTDYWKGPNAVNNETVAHLFEAKFDPAKKAAFKLVFPTAYAYLSRQHFKELKKQKPGKSDMYDSAEGWLNKTKAERKPPAP